MMEAKNLMRTPLQKSTAYIAGGMFIPDTVLGPKTAKLNANENPYGPSTKALEAMHEALSLSHLYPMPVLADFKAKLASVYGKEKEQFTIYNGSGAGINALADSFLNEGDEVLISSPTYMAYAPLPARYGAKIVESSSIDNVKTDLDALYNDITEHTKLIFICNPNNPTGTLLSYDELKAFVDKLPEHVICVVDEAYYHWIDDPSYKSAFDLVDDEHKVVVLRTFSKVYGMAGIRAGFAFSNKEIAALLGLSSNVFYSNRIAMKGAIAALEDTEFYDKVVKNNTEQRAYISEELEKLGCDVTPSSTSFIYFDAHCDCDACIEFLNARNIYIRPFAPCLRVSIGLPEENQMFLDAMKEFLGK